MQSDPDNIPLSFLCMINHRVLYYSRLNLFGCIRSLIYVLARSIVSLSALLIITSMTAIVQVAAAAGSVPTPFADDSDFSVFLPEGLIREDVDNTSPSSQSAG